MSSKSFSFGIGITNTPLVKFPGRKRRKWVSFVTTGCYNDNYVYVVHHCPVLNGVAQVHQAWQHRVIPT